MNNIERDEQRILSLYNRFYHGEDPTKELLYVISTYCTYMRDIPNLSEEFHRKYAKHYQSTQWYLVASCQTNFPEDLYDLSLENSSSGRCLFISPANFLTHLIKSNKVSEGWIRRNFYRIPPKVWEKVY
jgi:hypothetical protein